MSTTHPHGEIGTAKWTAAESRVRDELPTLHLDDKHPPKVHAPAEQLRKAESHIPDGPSALAYEAPILPWVIGALAAVGIGVVAFLMSPSGWRAVLIGEVWLLMGYAVSWIVVWGAGLMRARDEHEIEEHIIQDGVVVDGHQRSAGR
ncbi:MAG: hypothetical protein IT438_09060 [Phycisphaerales bacterium]|nr:hypothetical protein [Phycisphaerales bacterium]